MQAVLTTRVALPWSPELAWVKKALTVTSKPTSPLGTPSTLEMYEINNDRLYMPKTWALHNRTKLGIATVIDEQFSGEQLTEQDTALSLPAGLRPHQALAVDAIVKAFRSEPLGGGAMLILPCGCGKSITALAVMHRMAVKTLIIVNTSVLASQWQEVITRCVPGARVGLIQQAKYQVQGMTHVVAVAHTVAGERYDFADAGFNLICFDESHRMCCPTLSKCITKAGARWRLGLTATPVRADGFNAFLDSAIGPVAFQMKRENPEELKVYTIYLDQGPCNMHVVRAKGGISTPCIAKIVNDLEGGEPRAQERQEVAAGWIKLSASKGRHILVVADRISLLEDLAERVRDELQVAFLIGKTKAKDRETAKEATVIFASYACAAEGLDVPSLDTLLLLTPRSGSNVITQSVGRLLRNGGRTPVVIDMVDKLSVFESMYKKRCKVYRELGAQVTRFDEHFCKL